MFFLILFLLYIFFLLFSTIIFINKAKKCSELTEGKLRTKKDLKLVKDVINFNMRAAFFTLILNIFVIISAVLHLFIYKNVIYLLALFFNAIFSFITGIVCKKYEDMIRNLEIFEIEPDVGRIFTEYLEQWSKRQISLKEEI